MTAPAIAAGETVYDRVARAPHWLVAALAVFVLSLGWAIAGAPRNTPTRDLLLVMHRSVGVTILAVVLFRAIWRWRHPPPPLPPTVMGLERVLAGCTHAAFVLAAHRNAARRVCRCCGGGPCCQRVRDRFDTAHSGREQLALAGGHCRPPGRQYLLYLLVVLHIVGALRHGFVKRDGVLDRMLPVRQR
ncbi:MAG: cytochrome b [Stellaceae bacterium]